MNNQMSTQKGFTLIELIIVIVILGILAVTAAPRFIDLQSDAKISTINGAKAALQGSSQLVYAKAAIAGQQNDATATTSLSLSPSVTIDTVFGYPDGALVTATNIVNILDLSTGDFTVVAGGDDDPVLTDQFTIYFTGQDVDDACYLRYTSPAAVNTSPAIAVVTTGC